MERHLLNWRAHAIGTRQVQLCLTNNSNGRMQYAIVFTHEGSAIQGCREEYALTVGNKELTNANLAQGNSVHQSFIFDHDKKAFRN